MPLMMNAAGTGPDHRSAVHLPDLYADSVDCRAGGVGLGSLGDAVETGIPTLARWASTSFSSIRRTCAVLGPYTSSWK